MKRILALALAAIMLLCTCVSVSADESKRVEGSNVVENIGKLTVTKFNGIWDSVTANHFSIVTPGNSIGGLYYEKAYAKYNAEGGYYEVVTKVANHRSYSKVVEQGYIGILFSYAPLTSAGSSISRANWSVWQHVRVGDRLYLHNIDVANKVISTSGTWGSNFTSNSYITVETVRPQLPLVTPYSNRKIVAEGDSITAGGGWTSVWSDYFHTTVINAGFGGDTSWASLSARYETYVASHKPEIVIVSFGINDAYSAAPTTSLMDKYKTALRGIRTKNNALGATTMFMTANVIDMSTTVGGVFDKGDYSSFGGEVAYLDSFIDCMRQVAAEENNLVIDLYTMWKTKGLSPDCLIDSCHPDDAGYNANWEVQRPALIKNMKKLCGNDIRVIYGTTAKHAIDGMPDCTVTVKDANGNAVADSAVLKDGYKISYTYTENGTTYDVGTYTVVTLANEFDAPFELVDGSEYTLEENYVKVGTLGITAAKLKSQFKCEISVLAINGGSLADAGYIGTGCTVVQSDAAGAVINSVKVVIPGDLSGDGAVSTTDMVAVRRLLTDSNVSDLEKTAADLTGDSLVNTADFLMLRKHCDGSNLIY
ncbi:MAG: hypothetical protein IJB65_02220 [Clostridia bacterium]|nr:hypothetical protein [Clostridia bacterium]